MATVSMRKRRGRTVWVARVRRTKKGEGSFSEARTFDTKVEAEAWALVRDREVAKSPTVDDAVKRSPRRNPTVAEVIAKYLALKRDLSGSKRSVLRRLAAFPIGEVRVMDLRPVDIVDFASEKAERDRVLPQTVNRYLAELSAVIKFAKVYWSVKVDTEVMRDAWSMSDRLGVSGKSHRRDRRPTIKELDRLMRHFIERRASRPGSVPMAHIIAFAVFSTRRRGEICRIRWSDFDQKAEQVLVRDMKHPGERVGNNVRCDLPRPAAAIIRSLPRRRARIFPVDPETVSGLFREACEKLRIRNLHFHDLRHEGISRLFEMGWNVPRVMKVSGHRNLHGLQRYTHFNNVGDKFEGWPWIEAVTRPYWKDRR